MNISGKTQVCIILGDPVAHSLSPAMHNAAYTALNLDYVFLAAPVKAENLEHAIAGARAMHFRGITCTIPHKVEVMKYLDEIDPVAKKIGAVNTIVNNNGHLTGYNTDWLGTVTPLEQVTSLAGKRVALIGAGGAARAMVYGVTNRGAQVTIFNRTKEKADEIAKDFGATVKSLTELTEVKEYDIIINATSLGMEHTKELSPLPVELIQSHHIIFDAVYTPRVTKLLASALKKTATVIYGSSMLLHQGTAQFELYTGHKAPVNIMRSIIEPL